MKLFNILKKQPQKSTSMERCNFCERSRMSVQILLNYKESHICEACVEQALKTLQEQGFLKHYKSIEKIHADPARE